MTGDSSTQGASSRRQHDQQQYQHHLQPETTPKSQSAALRGATLAFGKPPTLKPKPILSSYGGKDGAMAAATKAGRGITTPVRTSPVHLRPSSITPDHSGPRETNTPLFTAQQSMERDNLRVLASNSSLGLSQEP